MSLNIEGQKCVSCNAYLFEEDDVVYCPECGAPHHRECYNALNHCALEHLHGTENEYYVSKNRESNTKENTEPKTANSDETICGMCGKSYDKNLKNCPECNAPNVVKLGSGFVGFDFLGGVPSDTDIGEGITANEAKRFVSSNTHRFIPRFLEMKNGRKTSWNWFALIFPNAWLLSRKMYKQGILVTVINIIATLFMFPFTIALGNYDTASLTDYNALVETITQNYQEIGSAVIFAAFFGIVVTIALSIFMGLFGDKIYYKHTISSIKEIKKSNEDVDVAYQKKGGVTLVGFAIGFMLIRFLPNIIISFLL